MLELDNDGFLKHLNDWNESVAVELAQQEGIELTAEHWEIVHLLRRFYQEFDISPAMRPLSKYIRAELGADKASSIYLLRLFPGSPAKMAARIAGLPRPENCL
ncbi:sulfurtransferase [Bacterioplanes sanyensis]|uniref:TusE/DsrC/DsvC family sulfur relay protein n=1 Tax=Bacterioplanes sanyensis TaxID=1249553 RepID=UPI00167C38EE|nr:TusE/DsrC/DsvC family sulfur relay protein [Bacterioplanes sanyensis]GGY41333.1 sulfurtransferase [Bacterioplanes sanyensis]